MPFLSIIVPVYNKKNYLTDCLESILTQTFYDFELILVNDGSTDGSRYVCEEYARLDGRIKVINQENKGVSIARNVGLEVANGSFIGFVDGDDILEPDMYEVLINNAVKFDAEISICGVKKIFSNKTQYFYGKNDLKVLSGMEAITFLLNKNFSGSANDRIFKKELAKSIRFEGRMNEDILYNFMAFTKVQKVVFQDVIKYNYLVRDNSASMASFNAKYMDAIIGAKRMVDICSEQMPEILNQARNFDFVTNLSLLNVVLLSGKQKFKPFYNQIMQNIHGYSNFMNNHVVSKKHKIAFYTVKYSPGMYSSLLKIYSKVADSEIRLRKSHNQDC